MSVSSETRSEASARIVAADDQPANRKRGGDIRTVLSPATAGTSSGFMGTATLAPGEVVTEHYHPYSEEFLFLVRGQLTVRLDGVESRLRAGEGLFVPIGVRHRLHNDGEETAFCVFNLGPLAPRPDLGHVDTEPLPPTP